MVFIDHGFKIYSLLNSILVYMDIHPVFINFTFISIFDYRFITVSVDIPEPDEFSIQLPEKGWKRR